MDGRLTTNGVPLYSSATSTSGLNLPTTSSIPTSLAPVANNDPQTSDGNRVDPGRLQSRYGAVVIGVSLLLSLI